MEQNLPHRTKPVNQKDTCDSGDSKGTSQPDGPCKSPENRAPKVLSSTQDASSRDHSHAEGMPLIDLTVPQYERMTTDDITEQVERFRRRLTLAAETMNDEDIQSGLDFLYNELWYGIAQSVEGVHGEKKTDQSEATTGTTFVSGSTPSSEKPEDEQSSSGHSDDTEIPDAKEKGLDSKRSIEDDGSSQCNTLDSANCRTATNPGAVESFKIPKDIEGLEEYIRALETDISTCEIPPPDDDPNRLHLRILKGALDQKRIQFNQRQELRRKGIQFNQRQELRRKGLLSLEEEMEVVAQESLDTARKENREKEERREIEEKQRRESAGVGQASGSGTAGDIQEQIKVQINELQELQRRRSLSFEELLELAKLESLVTEREDRERRENAEAGERSGSGV